MKPTRTIYIKHSGSLTAKDVFEMISENTLRTEEYEQSKKKSMKTITKSMIKLSDIPKEFHNDDIFKGLTVHTYIEAHIEKKGPLEDGLTSWLRTTYPNLSRKISFLIHIDI